jgi:exodeoxyribonuclease V alpha subunit
LTADVVTQGRAMVSAARAGDAVQALSAMDAHRVLCAHRQGRYGVGGWSRAAEAELRRAILGYGREGEWYLGRPVLITRNAPDLQISNGDTGVVVRIDGQIQVALSSGDNPRLRSPWLLDSSETMHAMTVHKSQGSEYDAVTVVLPSAESPLLTRELFYTAVTRARQRVRIVGTAEAIRQAVTTAARRATGLGGRV